MADIKFSTEKENYQPKPGEIEGFKSKLMDAATFGKLILIMAQNDLIWGPDIGISDPSQPPIKDKK